MRITACCVLFLIACGPNQRSSGSGPDANNPGDSCTGSETRCLGTAFQVCNGGTFQTDQNCPLACTPAGCTQCDPNANGGKACSGNDVVACNSDGTFGTVQTTCGNGMMCQDGACSNACTADGVDLIYAVDEADDFLSFDPRLLPANPFKKIGTLNCPHSNTSIQVPAGPVTPFSMSVDRDGKAWVEYSSGELFNVNLQTAACTPSGYVPQAAGMALFGMGYVSDAPMANTEKLFIAGGGHSAEPNGKLAWVDTHAMMYTPQVCGTVGPASDNSPELTGTNTAQLYGFFPVTSGGNAYVQEIDRASGTGIGQKWNLAPLTTVRDWAFAQWGGKFYIFTSEEDFFGNVTSQVRSIDKMTGAVKVEVANSQYQVDGAGVSTCAPSVIQ